MKMNFNEIQINHKDEIKLNLNDISSFLYKSGFLNKNKISKDKKELLIGNSKYNIINFFEFNTGITIKEANSKYKELLKSINLIFKHDSKYTLESLYNQYTEYTGRKIYLNIFLNSLIMLNYILTNFTEFLNLENNSDIIHEFQLDKKISIFSIDKVNDINDKSSIFYKLNELYDKMEQNSENKVNNLLIILIYIISLDGKLYVVDEIPNVEKLLEKFNLYNKIYVTNIHLSIILYIQMILLININFSSNNEKKSDNFSHYKNQFQELSRNELPKGHNNFTFTVYNNMPRYNNKTQILSTNRKLNHNIKSNNVEKNNIYNLDIPSFYLFNDDMNIDKENINAKIILFQNYLKYYSFYALSKNKIKSDINLSFESIQEIIKILSKEENSTKETGYNFFKEINENLIKKINLELNDFIDKDNINTIFNYFNINELIFKFMDTKNTQNIENISVKFINLIAKSNICYIQEPVDTLLNTNKQKDKDKDKTKSNRSYNSLTIKDLFTQFDILNFYLIFFHKNTEIKKAKTIHIKFNTFKCIINRENKKIQIYFNFSFIKERTLFHYLKHSSNILNLEEKYTDIILILREHKQYDITMRLCQNNFISNQLGFIFTLLIKRVSDFVNENKLNQRIVILETKFNNFNPNLQIYIKDENTKIKNRLLEIKQLILYPKFEDKFYVLSNYLENLVSLWNLIIFSDNDNEFKLLRTFEDNKLFFYLSRDNSNINQNSAENSSTLNSTNADNSITKSKKNLGVEYINIIMYIKNDENIFTKAMSFIEDLASDHDSVLEYKFTLIYDRFFIESNILMEPRMKRSVKIMYTLIDDLYMIAKNIKNENDINENDDNEEENEYYNYDIYLADSFIAVCNFHQYDIKADSKYHTIIYEFLSILSSCIEFILYILKNKDIYIPKFLYLLRTKKDNYYLFEYKESNMFIKKIKEFNSLIALDTKDCYPLFCFLSKKTQTNYTVSNDNFYDVFLRLFLNLNKVVESNEKLNEVFMHKIHKNIFYGYYDSFILIAFTFESVNFFNDFFMKNEYLKITNGEKFGKCYIILTEELSKRKQNYEILIQNMNDEHSIIVNKIISFNFNFKSSYFFINKKYSTMGFRKVEYLINEEINQVKSKIIPKINNNLTVLYKVFLNKSKSKENSTKIVNRIKMFMVGDKKINMYNNNCKNYEIILDEYIKEKNKMKAQKVEMRVFQLTEEAKNAENNYKNKKDCCIF